MKRFFLLFLLFAFFLNSIDSQEWIPLVKQDKEGKSVATELIESNSLSYKVKVTINGLYDNLKTKGAKEFHQISIQSDHYLSQRGDPMLPIIKQVIAIPPGATLSASIDEIRWMDVEMGKIYPVQNHDDNDYLKPTFYINEDSYNKPFIPSLIHIGEEMAWRGINNRQIAVCPFKYYPNENRLSVLRDFILKVDYIYTDAPNRSVHTAGLEDEYHLFDNVVNNNRQIRSQNITPRTQPDSITTCGIKYLIIVGDIPDIANSEAMTKFRVWKAAKGYDTEVVTLTSTNSTPNYIKSLITQKDENCNHQLRYVLFVGDSGKIPLYDFLGFGTGNDRIMLYSDYWYGCMGGDSDVEAEFPVGRFSVSTLQEFSNMVEKTIRYEKSYHSSNKVLLVANAEGAGQNGYQHCCDSVSLQVYADTVSFFIKAYGADFQHQGTCATNDTVIQAINNGAHIVNYRGHGSPKSWPYWNYLGESFTSSEIVNMNDSVNAVFLSVACQTGHLGADSCMLEVFTRSPHGAVAFIGANVDTNNGVNNNYEKNLFKKLLNDRIYHIGDMNVAAHIQSIDPFENRSKDNPHSYICGSDPSLEIWTNHPLGMGDINLYLHNDSIIIRSSIEGNYKISISSTDGCFIETIHASGGVCSFPKPANQFYFCVYKHNFFPYFAYFDSVTDYIENRVFENMDIYFFHSPFEIEDDMDEIETIVKKGTKVVIRRGEGGVLVNECFKCVKGACLEIR